MIWWAISFIPFLFITNYNLAMINMIFVGIGLGGPTYFIDRNISNIIDEDELLTNNRREASYYGVHAIFIRLATILVIFSVNIVFRYSGWEKITIATITEQQKLGLRVLMSVFPAVAMLIGIILLKFFPIGYERQKELQKIKLGK
ncbi:MAG: MFS transporter [Candidatus Helarchaeota archaeon]